MDASAGRSPFRHASTPSETRPLCGCGLSHTFPFCDGSQMIAHTQRAKELVRCGAKQADRSEARSLVA